MEVTVNVQAIEELKRVLARIPNGQLNMSRWDQCACGYATRDEWFRGQDFVSCNSFEEASSFFGVSRREAVGLFSGSSFVTPQFVIWKIDRLLARTNEPGQGAAQIARRQAIIDNLLATANQAAHKARRVATALVAVFF